VEFQTFFLECAAWGVILTFTKQLDKCYPTSYLFQVGQPTNQSICLEPVLNGENSQCELGSQLAVPAQAACEHICLLLLLPGGCLTHSRVDHSHRSNAKSYVTSGLSEP